MPPKVAVLPLLRWHRAQLAEHAVKNATSPVNRSSAGASSVEMHIAIAERPVAML